MIDSIGKAAEQINEQNKQTTELIKLHEHLAQEVSGLSNKS